MDYKKKYEGLIKNIEHLHESVNPEWKRTIECYIPELKESEDERIRKELKSFFDSEMSDYGNVEWRKGIRYGEIVAWLEKQGEKIDAIENFDTEFEKQVSYLIASTINKEHEYNESFVKWTANALLNYAKHELKKQGEQKSTDKIEPKFKVGDWIVQENFGVYKIIEICKSWYEVIDFKDHHHSICFDIEHTCHLWTIQDAEDGDILAYNDGSLTIFHYRLSGLDAGIYMSHVILTDKIEFKQTCAINNIHPATKEQRDLLFTKMKEAGYEYDDANKKLKKIERKPVVIIPKFHEGDVIKPKDGGHEPWKIMQVDISDKKYRFKDGYVIHFSQENDYELVEQKPTWSEEDEKIIDNIIDYIKPMPLFFESITGESGKEYTEEFIKESIKWLKSLKERYIWKPSNEQIKALNYVVNLMASSESPTENNYYYNVFKDMRTQLKKLKE